MSLQAYSLVIKDETCQILETYSCKPSDVVIRWIIDLHAYNLEDIAFKYTLEVKFGYSDSSRKAKRQ